MPATVIDSLIVTLGIDGSKFTEAQKRAAAELLELMAVARKAADALGKSSQAEGARREASGRRAAASDRAAADKAGAELKRTTDTARRSAMDMSSNGKLAAEFFGKVQGAASTLMAGLIGGGMAAYAFKATESIAGLGRAAENMNLPVSEVGAFGNAIRANGGDARAAQGTFQKLADEMAHAKIFGISPGISGAFQAIGGDINDSAMQTYMKFVRFAEENKDKGVGFIRQVGTGLGLDEGSVNEARRGTAQVQRDMADARSLGVPTKEMSDRMQALQRSFVRAQEAAEGLANAVLDKLAPALTAALDAVTAFIRDNPGLASAAGGGVLAAGALLAKKALGAAGAALRGGAAAAPGIAAAAPSAAAGLGLLSRLGLIGAAIGSAYEGFHIGGLNANEAELLRQGRQGGPGGAPAGGAAALFAGIEGSDRLPSGLLDSVWNVESGRGRHMLSGAGAKGHFQFMDATAGQYGVRDPNDLGQSARGAGRYFADLLRHFGGSADKAIAGYNWGQGNLDKDIAAHGDQWARFMPRETTDYLAKVRAGMAPGRDMAANMPPGAAGGGSQSVTVNGMVVQTQASDARGIAGSIRTALSGRHLAAQANTGLA